MSDILKIIFTEHTQIKYKYGLSKLIWSALIVFVDETLAK